MGGGAWPFLVGGAICLVNSDNERDSSLLNRRTFGISKAPGLGRVVFTTDVLTNLLRGTGGV